MYYPIGWPKSVNLLLPGENDVIKHISFDAVKILLAAIGTNFLGIWYANPLVPIVFNRRSTESVNSYGSNKLVVWRPDSKQLIILTTGGVLLLYQVEFIGNSNGVFTQLDSSSVNLRRESAELFIKENIPKLRINNICIIQLCFTVTTLCCINLTELLVATDQCELMRIQWSELETDELIRTNMPLPSDVIQLRSIQFYVSQQCNLNCVRRIGSTAYIVALEYSPFVGGYAVVFSDNRAAFLIVNHSRFETHNMHGFWIPEVEDATVCGINHKFRLLAFGRQNSEVAVYAIEDTTGGLEFSHRLSLNSFVAPGTLSAVNELKWSPDGCVLIVAWQNGGFALWSTFGTLLMSSLNWDYRLHMDLVNDNPLRVNKLEWSTEGYQLYMTCNSKPNEQHSNESNINVLQYSFVKSALTMNPCMASYPHILLQDDQCLYLNQGDTLEKMYFGGKAVFPNSRNDDIGLYTEDCIEVKNLNDVSSALMESKYWTVLHLPQTYVATNWPIRYSAIDYDGIYLAVAGRTGLAHYCMITKKWKLFGNESQEKDFVVSGGLLWWRGFIVAGCYSLLEQIDEIRCYPEECKLDNQYLSKISLKAPVISINMFREQLIVLTADGIVSLFVLNQLDAYTIAANCVYEVDVKSICIHPACIVSLTVTNLRNDLTSKNLPSSSSSSAATAATLAAAAANNTEVSETIIVNVCGRILMIQKDNTNTVLNNLMATCLASCVECFWLSNSTQEAGIMRDCLWLFSGVHGMRVWLPILPPVNEQIQDASHRLHTFMSKRIMLSFPLKLYPLVILFDNVMVLGVENETTLYTNEASSHFTLPFSQLERISQVYLHKILRQLIKRNLGYSAWEIAQSCRRLPYFPHSLELLLHEVLEEEATSKEPIPDALLPRVLDFIREFPVYYQTIVQCARKTEIALWPHLFSIAGKPKDLFRQCLESEELVTAASYLIILQNLETSTISREYATLLLEVALQHCKWDLAKDLIRFLKAIDPNEIDSPRSSMVVNMKIAPPSQSQSQVNNNPDVFNLVLGPIARDRSFSTTVLTNTTNKDKKDKTHNTTVLQTNNTNSLFRKKSERNSNSMQKERRETFCIENILQRNARNLLQNYKLIDLGYMSAHLDFHLVAWLSNESEQITCFEDYVFALSALHEELKLPSPIAVHLFADDSDLDYNHMQQRFPMEKQNNHAQTFSQTSESGYFSLAFMDTPTSTNNGNITNLHIPSIKENEELNYSSIAPFRQPFRNVDLIKSLSNSQMSLDSTATGCQNYYSSNEIISPLAYATINLACTEITNKVLSEKVAIKIRYLLQLFIEANCIDYALVLSILLQDAASIGRIINVVIRSEPIHVCRRIQSSLRTLSQWAFDNDCVYRSFIISLQSHLHLLDQYLQNSTAVSPTAVNHNGFNNTHIIDKGDEMCRHHLKSSTLHDTQIDNNSNNIRQNTLQLNGNGNREWPSYDKYSTNQKYHLKRNRNSEEFQSTTSTQHLMHSNRIAFDVNDHSNYKSCNLM